MIHPKPRSAARQSLGSAIQRLTAEAIALLLLLGWVGLTGAHTGGMTGFATITISEKSVGAMSDNVKL